MIRRLLQMSGLRVGAVAVLAALCLVACGGESSTAPAPGGGTGGGSGGPGPGDGSPEVPEGSRTVTVEMQGISYNAPGGGDFVHIGLGERVRWVNLDGTPHTVTTTSAPTGGKGFNSGLILPGREYVFTPSITGTWEYSCLQHPVRMANARLRVD